MGTMDNVDSLSGRALDVAVAQYLFGFEVEERENKSTHERDAVCRHPGKPWVRCAFYSEGLGASLNIEYELSKRGWTWQPAQRTGSRWSQPGLGRVVLVHVDGRTVAASGISVNQALARAALLAVSQG